MFFILLDLNFFCFTYFTRNTRIACIPIASGYTLLSFTTYWIIPEISLWPFIAWTTWTSIWPRVSSRPLLTS